MIGITMLGFRFANELSFLLIMQGRVIYHQTMTPIWMKRHSSYIDSYHTATTHQLTFRAGALDNGALLKVPMVPGGVLRVSTLLTVQITVAADVGIGSTADSDIRYGVSDGTRFVGFETPDRWNYGNNAPCYGIEGISGPTLSSIRGSPIIPKPRDSFYPGQFVFTLKLNERWGACYTAHDGGFVRTASYNNRLMPSKGLTLEVYEDNKGERVGIRFIKVTIFQDQ